MKIARSVAALVAGIAVAFSPVAHADPAGTTAEGMDRSPIYTYKGDVVAYKDQPGVQQVAVWSKAMGRYILVNLQVPEDRSKPRPALVLLNGAGGGEDTANWQGQTDVKEFFKDKNVFVATPMSGAFSYYTDWQKHDPVFADHPKWQTFLNEELLQALATKAKLSDKRAVVGMSMTGTTVFNLAIHKQGYWSSIASYSGCASTSDPAGQAFIKLVLERGNANPENMWGPYNGQGWRDNDPLLNADGLRGTDMYVYSGFGLPGVHDRKGDKFVQESPLGEDFAVANQILVGGGIEAATGACTVALQAKLAQLGIPATFDIRADGTHSWGYWQDALHRSWPQLARAIGA